MSELLLVGKGTEILKLWRNLLEHVSEFGTSQQGKTEMMHLTVVCRKARPLAHVQLQKYREIVGPAAWERMESVYNAAKDLKWKPSYMRRLANWRDERGEIDQLDAIMRRAARSPGAKTLCCTILDPRDLNRFISASIPCLLSIDFKIRSGQIHLAAFFRSQDVFRFFLGDYHHLCLIAETLARSLRKHKQSREFSIGTVLLHLCSAHFRRSDFQGGRVAISAF